MIHRPPIHVWQMLSNQKRSSAFEIDSPTSHPKTSMAERCFAHACFAHKNSTAITSKQNCMLSTCRNLGVSHTCIQRRDVALPLIMAASNHTAITSNEQCIRMACRNLRI